MPDSQKLGVAWTYERIESFCEDRANGIGGHYGQDSYKSMFYDIFVDAIVGSYAGAYACDKFKKRLKHKRILKNDYVISGHSIRTYLERKWLRGKNSSQSNKDMVNTLCEWWDLWEFGIRHFPGDSSVPKRRKRVKESFERWLNDRKADV